MVQNSQDIGCIQFWEDELGEVENALLIATAERQDKEDEKKCLTEWEAALKVYWDNIVATNKQAKSISREIGVIQNNANRVKELTACTVIVCEKAFCLVQDYYSSMDALKLDITNLLKEIECLNNPDINAKTSFIVGNLSELNGRLDTAISTQKDTLLLMMTVLERARELDRSVGDEENTNPTDPSGLLWLLAKLLELFNSGGTPAPADGEATNYGEGCSQAEKSCNSKIEPKPVTPLENDPYYTETKAQYEKAQSEQDTAEDEYNAAREVEEALMASKNSLQKAIDKAKKAKGC